MPKCQTSSLKFQSDRGVKFRTPREAYLSIALAGKFSDLSLDGVFRTALLNPTCTRHHTVRAVLVATVDDVDPRADVRATAWLGDVLHDV